MKKLFIVCTAVGFLVACHSNKKSSSSNRSEGQMTQQTNNSNNVNRINEETNYTPAESKSHLDSVMQNSGGSSRKYNNQEGRFQGASGVGTGGSYAGAGYAQARYKKKPKIKRTFDAPVEEAEINRNADSTILSKKSINNNAADSTNLSKEITDVNETSDSASTNINSNW